MGDALSVYVPFILSWCCITLSRQKGLFTMSIIEEEETLLIYTAQGSPFRRKKLSVINGSPEQQRTKTTLNI